MKKLVSINILNTNEKMYLKRCIDMVLNQTYPNIEVTVIDNASSDGSVEFVEQTYPGRVKLIKNTKNLWYVGGHNKGISSCEGNYVMPLNADVFMTPKFVEEKVKAMEMNEEIGMVEGKLLQIKADQNVLSGTKVIDSTGVVMTKARRNFDRGHGQLDQGQFDEIEYIFGPSGAAPLYRREMLEDIKINREYLDDNFFIYREEVDLAWRAQLRGWRCVYTPYALAYHVRGYSPGTRKKVPHFYKQLQFRNRYLMIIKNEQAVNFFRHFPHILCFEVMALTYAILREPYLLTTFSQFFRLLPDTLKKRKCIMGKRKAAAGYMLQWFV